MRLYAFADKICASFVMRVGSDVYVCNAVDMRVVDVDDVAGVALRLRLLKKRRRRTVS